MVLVARARRRVLDDDPRQGRARPSVLAPRRRTVVLDDGRRRSPGAVRASTGTRRATRRPLPVADGPAGWVDQGPRSDRVRSARRRAGCWRVATLVAVHPRPVVRHCRAAVQARRRLLRFSLADDHLRDRLDVHGARRGDGRHRGRALPQWRDQDRRDRPPSVVADQGPPLGDARRARVAQGRCLLVRALHVGVVDARLCRRGDLHRCARTATGDAAAVVDLVAGGDRFGSERESSRLALALDRCRVLVGRLACRRRHLSGRGAAPAGDERRGGEGEHVHRSQPHRDAHRARPRQGGDGSLPRRQPTDGERRQCRRSSARQRSAARSEDLGQQLQPARRPRRRLQVQRARRRSLQGRRSSRAGRDRCPRARSQRSAQQLVGQPPSRLHARPRRRRGAGEQDLRCRSPGVLGFERNGERRARRQAAAHLHRREPRFLRGRQHHADRSGWRRSNVAALRRRRRWREVVVAAASCRVRAALR